VTGTEYRKALLLAKIEAHRSVFHLELRCARATVDPVNEVLTLLGIDQGLAGTAVAAFRSLHGGKPDGLSAGGSIVPLLVAALLPLVSGRAADEEASRVVEKESAPA
jgi:hypothetical protein